MTSYSPGFYGRLRMGMRRSAKEIVPIILDLLKPKSVIDVGCGVGTWLSVFHESGLDDIFGIDGDWVDKNQLEIPHERFLSADLSKPVQLSRKFDLVLSLEVAEHLPADSAVVFIDSLIRLGPLILFSAAIPYQGGKNHINEQWQDYWVEHFRSRDYIAIDFLRKRVWQNQNVEWWYAQNTLLFSRQDYLNDSPILKKEFEQSFSQACLVHPRAYLEAMEWNNRIRMMIRDLRAAVSSDEKFIFVDEDQFRELIAVGRRVLPFLERDGQYWGAPADDANAILEFERLRQSGANFIAFAWPAFWWLDYYRKFQEHLRSKFRLSMENDRLIVFDLRPC